MPGQHRASSHPPRSGPRELFLLLELIGLSAFAVAQPVLDVFGKSPETFVFHGAGRREIVLFASLWVLVPPLALWLAGLATRPFGPGVRRQMHRGAVWGLGSLLAFQVIKRMGVDTAAVILPVGILLGATLAWLLTRDGPVRSWLSLGSVGGVAFVLIFLLVSPVSGLFNPAPIPSAPAPRRTNGTPVVMVIFDQLPLGSLVDASGRIDGTRYPNFARLAAEGTWYRNFGAAAFHTRWAVPALLTGRKVVLRKRSGFEDHPKNLFTLLRNTHEMRVFESFTDLCPDRICPASDPLKFKEAEDSARTASIDRGTGTRTGLRGVLKDSIRAWWDISAPFHVRRDIMTQFTEETEVLDPASRMDAEDEIRVPGPWAAFLRSLGPSKRPVLHFAHALVPHYPWRFFPNGMGYDPGDIPRVEQEALDLTHAPLLWSDTQWPIQLERQRHLLQVQYADRLLGTLLRRMEDTGLYERSLLVVTSDHGTGAATGGKRSDKTLHQGVWIPLFVRSPGQEKGTVDDINLSALDLLPSIADLLEVDIPWRVDGRSAFDGGAPRGDAKVFLDPETPKADPITLSLETAWSRLRRDAFRPNVELDDDPFLLHRVGPGASMIGKAVGGFRSGPLVSATVTLDRATTFDEVDRSSGQVPALITGWVPDAPQGTLVAAVVNGRVAGVSPRYRSGGRPGRFSLLVPEPLIRDGRNDVRLFLTEGSVFRPLQHG